MEVANKMSVAIICSGGDCAGMNPALKTFVEILSLKKIKAYFIYEGYEGLINNNIKEATYKDVSRISHLGGTIIRTSRSKRFFEYEYRQEAYNNLKKLNISKLIVLGGDGSFNAMSVFCKEFDISFVGVPSTIDNDIYKSDYSLGVDTCLNVIRRALDDIADTSSSFARAFVVETMGRDCGYLALISSLSSGAEICIIPEIKPNFTKIEKRLKEEVKNGRTYILAIVSEGSHCTKELASFLEDKIKLEARILNLGHIQRGGNPSVKDRLMAYEFINEALKVILGAKKVQGIIISKDTRFEFLPIKEFINNKHEIKKELLAYVHRLSH